MYTLSGNHPPHRPPFPQLHLRFCGNPSAPRTVQVPFRKLDLSYLKPDAFRVWFLSVVSDAPVVSVSTVMSGSSLPTVSEQREGVISGDRNGAKEREG